MRVLLKAITGGLLRLGLVILVGSALAFTLGLLYPVQREMDLGRYEYATYNYEVDGVFPQPVAGAVAEAMGPGSCLVSVWLTKLQSSTSEVGPAEVDVLAPTCHGDTTRFPADLQIASTRVTTANWIDINADAAQALHVQPGDTVEVMVAPTVPSARLVVRAVFAVRATGAAAAAMAPADAMFPRLPAGQQPGYGLALARRPLDQILPLLDASPVRAQLENAKAYPPISTSVSERLTRADELSSNSLGLVRTIGALAALGVLVLCLRELDVFRRRWLPSVQTIHHLGGSSVRLLVAISSAAALVSLVAVSAGLVLAAGAYHDGVVASCLPPTLLPLVGRFWIASAASCLIFSCILGAVSFHRVHR